MAEHVINLNKIEFTAKIKVSGILTFRLAIACFLIKIAIFIAGGKSDFYYD